MEYTKVNVDGVDKLVVTIPQPAKEEVYGLKDLEDKKADIQNRREAMQVKADEAVKWRKDNENWFISQFANLDAEEAEVDGLILKAQELEIKWTTEESEIL